MAGVVIKFEGEQTRAMLNELHHRVLNMRPVYEILGVIALRAVYENFRVGGRPVRWQPLSPVTRAARRKRSSNPLLDTGLLRSSIGVKVTDEYVAVGTALKYARIHQFGGTITPINARYLAIPLRPETRNRRPREFDAFVYRSRQGNLFLAQNTGNQLVLLFLLKRQVRIPARPYLKLTMDDVARLRQAVEDYLNEVTGNA